VCVVTEAAEDQGRETSTAEKEVRQRALEGGGNVDLHTTEQVEALESIGFASFRAAAMNFGTKKDDTLEVACSCRLTDEQRRFERALTCIFV
jgi:hypothetical protein